jgi:type II secretory pathway pseudopilin PulG
MSYADAKWLRPVGWGLAAVIAVTIIAAIAIVGSPFEARKVAMDDVRLSDLEGIRQQAEDFYQKNHRLPPDLKALNANSPNSLWQGRYQDPTTGSAYGYKPLDARRFELSAVFDADTMNRSSESWYGDEVQQKLWRHRPGRATASFQVSPVH